MAELVNKINGPWFSKFDEDLATAFSIYCGISIAHVSNWLPLLYPDPFVPDLGVRARPLDCYATFRVCWSLLASISPPKIYYFPSCSISLPGPWEIPVIIHPTPPPPFLWQQPSPKPLVSFFLGNVGSHCPELAALAWDSNPSVPNTIPHLASFSLLWALGQAPEGMQSARWNAKRPWEEEKGDVLIKVGGGSLLWAEAQRPSPGQEGGFYLTPMSHSWAF